MNNEVVNSHDASIVPFRIRVGVVGHRSLSDELLLQRRIEAILDSRYREAFVPEAREILQGMPVSSVVFTVVSSLAEGADRLVARTVLDRPRAYLEAMLPFPPEEYLCDFHSQASKEEFHDLLALAKVVEVVPETSADPAHLRSRGYRPAGERVLAASDIVIAIWDGKPSRGAGGTAEMVDLARQRRQPVFVIAPESGEITLSNGGAQPVGHLARLEAFNSWPVPDGEVARLVEEEYRSLLQHPAAHAIPDSTKKVVRELLLPPYARASAIAAEQQGQYLRAGEAGYLLAVLAVLILAAATSVHALKEYAPWLYGLEMFLLSFVSYLIHQAGHRRVHQHWLVHRALAERFRCALFFICCGFNPGYPVNSTGLEHEANDASLGNAMLREVDWALPPSDPQVVDVVASSGFVKTCWIDGQIAFHRQSLEGNPAAGSWLKRLGTRRSNETLKGLGKGMFIAAVAASAVHFIFSFFEEPTGARAIFEELVTVAAITLPAAGAAWNGYRTLLEFSRRSSRSEIMLLELQSLEQLFGKVETLDELGATLKATERLMLAETRDWVQTMSFADLESVA